MEKIHIPFLCFCFQRPAHWVDHWLQEPKVSMQRECFASWSFVWLVRGWCYFSFQFWWHCVGDPKPWHTASWAGESESTPAGLQLCKSFTFKIHKIHTFLSWLSQNCTGRELISWYTWFRLFLGGQRAGRGCGGLEGPRSPWKPPDLCLHWPCKPWLWRYQTF